MYVVVHPYRAVQRGNNCDAGFIDLKNYQYYLFLWEKLSPRYGLDVHAYCFMTNPARFVVTPKREKAVSSAMKAVGHHTPSTSTGIPPHRYIAARTL